MDILVWGGSGHAKVLRPVIRAAGRRVAAIVERDRSLPSPFDDAVRLQSEDEAMEWLRDAAPENLEFVIAIGGRHGAERLRLATLLQRAGAAPFTAIHTAAHVAETAVIGAGSQVLAMAAVCEEARLGAQCIVNTNASVDHECHLDDGVHVMPGATLAGCVTVGDRATIGSNATVLPRVKIGADAFVGAGAVVDRDVESGTTVVGVPARPLNRRSP